MIRVALASRKDFESAQRQAVDAGIGIDARKVSAPVAYPYEITIHGVGSVPALFDGMDIVVGPSS